MIEQYRARARCRDGSSCSRRSGLIGNKYTVDWSRYAQADWSEPVRTGRRARAARGARRSA